MQHTTFKLSIFIFVQTFFARSHEETNEAETCNAPAGLIISEKNKDLIIIMLKACRHKVFQNGVPSQIQTIQFDMQWYLARLNKHARWRSIPCSEFQRE